MNLTRYRRIIRDIVAHPESHKQESWHCGTSHCVAGHAHFHAIGYKTAVGKDWDKLRERVGSLVHRFVTHRFAQFRPTGAYSVAKDWLKLTESEADWLFNHGRTLAELREVAKTGKFPERIL